MKYEEGVLSSIFAFLSKLLGGKHLFPLIFLNILCGLGEGEPQPHFKSWLSYDFCGSGDPQML